MEYRDKRTIHSANHDYGKTVAKTEEQYTQEDFARLSKNYKAMNILYC